MSTPASPLEQLEQQSSQAQPASQTQVQPSASPLEQLEQMSAKPAQQTTPAGQVTNDVGNTVIVPKDGESFADTMKRAAAQGQRTTPNQINREIATMPGKAATVLAAAPAMGATGAALMGAAGSPSSLGATEPGLLNNVGEPIVKAAVDHLGNLTKIVRAAQAMGWGAFGLKEAHDIYKMVSGDKK